MSPRPEVPGVACALPELYCQGVRRGRHTALFMHILGQSLEPLSTAAPEPTMGYEMMQLPAGAEQMPLLV